MVGLVGRWQTGLGEEAREVSREESDHEGFLNHAKCLQLI